MTRPTHPDRERGATLAEFAIVSVVAFLFIFGMLDMALIVLGNSVGSNAARDGARIGIVNFHAADVVGSSANTDIRSAVLSRLAGNIADTTVTIACKGPDAASDKSCAEDQIDVGRDIIEVRVQWKHKGTSPFVPVTTHSATSRMVISGPPSPT